VVVPWPRTNKKVAGHGEQPGSHENQMCSAAPPVMIMKGNVTMQSFIQMYMGGGWRLMTMKGNVTMEFVIQMYMGGGCRCTGCS
jgi:hypothetical protein